MGSPTTRPVTEREIRSALRSLGNTPNQVARALDILGCRGSSDCEFCPVAMFLERVFGDRIRTLQINSTDAIVGAAHYTLFLRLSKVMRQFVVLFDTTTRYENLRIPQGAA